MKIFTIALAIASVVMAVTLSPLPSLLNDYASAAPIGTQLQVTSPSISSRYDANGNILPGTSCTINLGATLTVINNNARSSQFAETHGAYALALVKYSPMKGRTVHPMECPDGFQFATFNSILARETSPAPTETAR